MEDIGNKIAIIGFDNKGSFAAKISAALLIRKQPLVFLDVEAEQRFNKNKSKQICKNPNCNNVAVKGRSHCSGECYKNHYGIK